MLIENVKCHSFVLKLNTEDIKVCNRNQSTNQSKHFGFIFWLFTERDRRMTMEGPERKTSKQT